MTRELLLARTRELAAQNLPLPAAGHTAERHRRLIEVGREDLSLARLLEAHWDAIAILAEANRTPAPGALYGVWAAEIPGKPLTIDPSTSLLHGTKMFCSGAGIVDRALLTVGLPEPRLIDLDLHSPGITFDDSTWHTEAFAETKTATATFNAVPVQPQDHIGPTNWYLDRPGFWHGACGPAACWAGGAIGLVDWALTQRRDDPHTLAHLGAMHSSAWALRSCLETAGHEIDAAPTDIPAARIRARAVRHLVEQASTDILRRIARAYGPYPLAMDATISRRYHELDLYLRQCHAERDLEALAHDLRNA